MSLLDDLWRHAVVKDIRCQQRDSTVMVFVVVAWEKALATGTCVLDGTESVGELGPVLEGFEPALRVWLVVRDVRATMGFGYAPIGQHRCHRLGGHRGSAIGADGESAVGNLLKTGD